MRPQSPRSPYRQSTIRDAAPAAWADALVGLTAVVLFLVLGSLFL